MGDFSATQTEGAVLWRGSGSEYENVSASGNIIKCVSLRDVPGLPVM